MLSFGFSACSETEKATLCPEFEALLTELDDELEDYNRLDYIVLVEVAGPGETVIRRPP